MFGKKIVLTQDGYQYSMYQYRKILKSLEDEYNELGKKLGEKQEELSKCIGKSDREKEAQKNILEKINDYTNIIKLFDEIINRLEEDLETQKNVFNLIHENSHGVGDMTKESENDILSCFDTIRNFDNVKKSNYEVSLSNLNNILSMIQTKIKGLSEDEDMLKDDIKEIKGLMSDIKSKYFMHSKNCESLNKIFKFQDENFTAKVNIEDAYPDGEPTKDELDEFIKSLNKPKGKRFFIKRKSPQK